jgi:hypothetical protein
METQASALHRRVLKKSVAVPAFIRRLSLARENSIEVHT